MFRRSICTEPDSEQVGSVLVLGAEVVQVGPIQMFGPKQNYLSKHLDRTSTGPGSEQLPRLNSLIDCGYSFEPPHPLLKIYLLLILVNEYPHSMS